MACLPSEMRSTCDEEERRGEREEIRGGGLGGGEERQPRREPEDEQTEEEETRTHLAWASARSTRNRTSSILHRLAWMCSACERACDWRRRLARTGVTPVAPQHTP
jgi:hypothetical protein